MLMVNQVLLLVSIGASVLAAAYVLVLMPTPTPSLWQGSWATSHLQMASAFTPAILTHSNHNRI